MTQAPTKSNFLRETNIEIDGKSIFTSITPLPTQTKKENKSRHYKVNIFIGVIRI